MILFITFFFFIPSLQAEVRISDPKGLVRAVFNEGKVNLTVQGKTAKDNAQVYLKNMRKNSKISPTKSEAEKHYFQDVPEGNWQVFGFGRRFNVQKTQ